MTKFELDGRYLIKRHASQSEVVEVTVLERSMDGKFVNGGAAGWFDAAEAVVLAQLPEKVTVVEKRWWQFWR